MWTRRRFSGILAASAAAADWPQWRGIERDGRTAETGLLKQWPAKGPEQLWRVTTLGEGYSSFAVAGGKLYTQSQKNGKQWVVALDANTGKTLWETAAGEAFPQDRGPGPRGTPTLDGDTLYSLSADGTLLSLTAATGKKNWEQNILREYNGSQINWGLSESPLVDGSRLIVTPGGKNRGVVALDKKTGRALWGSGDDQAGYSSAIAFDFAGQRHLVLFTAHGAMGLNAANGWLMWKYNKVANRVANVATPLYHDGHVFLSSDYGTGCALLKLSAAGDRVNATEVYFNKDMRNHYCSSVLQDKHVYGFSSGILTAMDFLTGEVAWRERSVGKGQVILAGGLLYLQGENGSVALAEATPTGYKELSRFEFGHDNYPLWTLPVISAGKLYLRDQSRLVCYNISNG
ncbi:MAG TPA: PQQ-binding-like beta-propeller repeat protein [Bryobacteraceae bacterium]|nr:PQQ-binding-like beta-propeller repeat protein [Bryobacteraceae bacterium]